MQIVNTNAMSETFEDKLLILVAISVIINMFYLYKHFGTIVIHKGRIIFGAGEGEQFYLCPHFRGGLGNLLFEYASVYGIAKQTGMKVGLYASDEINKVFNLSLHLITNKSICANAPIVREKKSCAYNISSINVLRKKSHYKHKSYLQSWKYFSNVEEDLRKLLVFSSLIQIKAEHAILDALKSKFKSEVPKNLTIVGVHVRRGDLLKKFNRNFGYHTATKEYISKAMKYFRDKFKNTVFLVFTNPNKQDWKWCTDNIKGSDVVMIKGNPREIDMCVLSKCNHTIMTVGSFGWWSSWLNKGKTIYYKNVTKPGSKLRNEFSADMTDYFYPTWIGM